MGKLTAKRRRFALEYLVDLNGSAAAIRAGYSRRTSRAIASELLKDPDVKALVETAGARRTARLELTADDVLRELLRIARVDVADAFEEDGRLRPLKDIPEDTRRAIAGIDVEDRQDGRGEDAEHYTVRKVRFWDKPRALELLGKHLKLFADRVEHSGLNGGPIQKSIEVTFVEPDGKPQPG